MRRWHLGLILAILGVVLSTVAILLAAVPCPPAPGGVGVPGPQAVTGRCYSWTSFPSVILAAGVLTFFVGVGTALTRPMNPWPVFLSRNRN